MSRAVDRAPSRAPSSSTAAGRAKATAPATKASKASNDVKHADSDVAPAERSLAVSSTFVSGMLAISAAQFIGAPLRILDPALYRDYMAFTKRSFAVLVTSITHWFAPTHVRVSGDASVQDEITQGPDGQLACHFPERMVLMANHQLYTDWLYLWWTAYANGSHGHVYIILKESLRSLPILGRVGQLFNFIFVARKWETGQQRADFRQRIRQLNTPADPMWLLIFPEGTNLSAETRATSRAWAAKSGVADLRHQLLPRSTGLHVCLQELKKTTDWLYDCTIAYEGVPKDGYAQDVFTLQSTFMDGKPPKSVNMHWRKFSLSAIPIDNQAAFEMWLRNRWIEKDHYLEHFRHTGRFPADKPWERKTLSREKAQQQRLAMPAASVIATEIKPNNLQEFMAIFAPVAALVTAVLLFHGASETMLMSPDIKSALMQQTDAVRDLLTQKSASSTPDVQRLMGMLSQGLAGGGGGSSGGGGGGNGMEALQQGLKKLMSNASTPAANGTPGTVAQRAKRTVPVQRKLDVVPKNAPKQATPGPATAARKAPARAAVPVTAATAASDPATASRRSQQQPQQQSQQPLQQPSTATKQLPIPSSARRTDTDPRPAANDATKLTAGGTKRPKAARSKTVRFE